MASYPTCTGCVVPRSECSRLSEIKDALRGLRVTSVKFQCADRKEVFRIGQRVDAKVTFWDNTGEIQDPWFDTRRGTVISLKKTKSVLLLDDNSDLKNETGYIKISSDRVTAIDEPDLTVCETCHSVSPEYTGCQRNADYHPYGCKTRQPA